MSDVMEEEFDWHEEFIRLHAGASKALGYLVMGENVDGAKGVLHNVLGGDWA